VRCRRSLAWFRAVWRVTGFRGQPDFTPVGSSLTVMPSFIGAPNICQLVRGLMKYGQMARRLPMRLAIKLGRKPPRHAGLLDHVRPIVFA
jgi:hypothetical protein